MSTEQSPTNSSTSTTTPLTPVEYESVSTTSSSTSSSVPSLSSPVPGAPSMAINYHTTQINIHTAPTLNNQVNNSTVSSLIGSPSHMKGVSLVDASPSLDALSSSLPLLSSSTAGALTPSLLAPQQYANQNAQALMPSALPTPPSSVPFTSSALLSIQNLSYTFSHIASVLEREEGREGWEHKVDQRMAQLQSSVDACRTSIKDIHVTVARAHDQYLKKFQSLQDDMSLQPHPSTHPPGGNTSLAAPGATPSILMARITQLEHALATQDAQIRQQIYQQAYAQAHVGYQQYLANKDSAASPIAATTSFTPSTTLDKFPPYAAPSVDPQLAAQIKQLTHQLADQKIRIITLENSLLDESEKRKYEEELNIARDLEWKQEIEQQLKHSLSSHQLPSDSRSAPSASPASSSSSSSAVDSLADQLAQLDRDSAGRVQAIRQKALSEQAQQQAQKTMMAQIQQLTGDKPDASKPYEGFLSAFGAGSAVLSGRASPKPPAPTSAVVPLTPATPVQAPSPLPGSPSPAPSAALDSPQVHQALALAQQAITYAAYASTQVEKMKSYVDEMKKKQDEMGGNTPVDGADAGMMLGYQEKLQMKKTAEKLKEQDRAIWALESKLSNFIESLGDFKSAILQNKEVQDLNIKRVESDMSQTLQNFSNLSRQFQAQHRVLDGRLTNYREEFDSIIKTQMEALSSVEKNLEKKADVRLVLDKVSRSEYATQIRKLKKADDELASRAVARDEYKLSLSEMKETLQEDQRERNANISKIANELSKLVSDINNKASKNDLVDMANMLNNMPKFSSEIENLKEFVNAEINMRTNEILDVAVDRKQLKRSMQRLLRSLQDEVTAATLPVNCDACALRTGVHSGVNCLSCATQLRLQSKFSSYSGTGYNQVDPSDKEIVASRGGGFIVSAPPFPNPYPRRSVPALENRPTTSSQGSVYMQGGATTSNAVSGSSILQKRPQTTLPSMNPRQQQTPTRHANGAYSATPPPNQHNDSNIHVFSSTAPISKSTNSHSSSNAPTPSPNLSQGDSPANLQTIIPMHSLHTVRGSDGKLYTAHRNRTHKFQSNKLYKSSARLEEEGWSANDDKLNSFDSKEKDEQWRQGSQSARS